MNKSDESTPSRELQSVYAVFIHRCRNLRLLLSFRRERLRIGSYSEANIDTHGWCKKPITIAAFRARGVVHNVSDRSLDKNRLGIAKDN
jgi:hypothetical protein